MQMKSSKPSIFSLFALSKMKTLTLVLLFLTVGISYIDLSMSRDKVSALKIHRS